MQPKMSSIQADQWSKVITASHKDPTFFQTQVYGNIMAPHQIDLANCIAKYPKTVVVSGNSMGKTFMMGGFAGEFLCTRPESMVLTTAPSKDQVVDQLWGEIRKNYDQAVRRGFDMSPFGVPLTQKWEVAPKWYAEGKAVKVESSGGRKDAVRIQGYHAPYVLIIIDEASGVPNEIWEGIDRLRTTQNVKLVVIGNPNYSVGKFRDADSSAVPYESIKAGSAAYKQGDWVSLHWPSLHSPNVINPGHGIKSWTNAFATPQWIDEMEKEHGRDSAWFQISVLAQFPDMQIDSLFKTDWLFDCTDNRVPARGTKPVVAIGCDVARFGGDETVIKILEDGNLIRTHVGKHRSTTATAGQVMHFSNKFRADSVAIDDTGVGGGVTDQLRDATKDGRFQVKNMNIHGVNNAGDAMDKAKYANIGTQVWHTAAMAARDGDISIPKDKHWARLISDLTSRKYDYDMRGRMRLEPKDEMKKRGLKSPDHGDAWTLAVWAHTRVEHRKQFFVSLRQKTLVAPTGYRGSSGYGFLDRLVNGGLNPCTI